MGIPGLWDVLRDAGEIVPLAKLSAEHYETHGRPLRVAIDESGWRFNNLTDWQVKQIREKSTQAANPIEKAVLWRILKLRRLNIQPLFVLDGPARPWKHGKTAGKIDPKKSELLLEMLGHLKIPHHRAPGEAEAECAQLEQQGVVDAVWSDDGDALMFGARVLIRHHKEPGKPTWSNTHVKVFRAAAIERDYGLDRAGFVLFALLSGGDYNSSGLKGCGALTAHVAAKWNNGSLGRLLTTVPLSRIGYFTDELREYFAMGRTSIAVPPDFPRTLDVKNYREPKVSTVEQCTTLQSTRMGWDMEIDEGGLRRFLRERFDFQAKSYIQHITPLLLIHHLNRIKGNTSGNEVFEIKLVQKRGTDVMDPCVEREVTYNPIVCSNLDLSTQPPDEDWSTLGTKDGPFNPREHVRLELLDCLLRNLGEAEMARLKQEARSSTRKRKSKSVISGDDNELDGSRTSRRSKHRAGGEDPVFRTDQGTSPSSTKRKGVSQKTAKQEATSNKKPKPNAIPAPPPKPREVRQIPKFKLPAALRVSGQNTISTSNLPTQSRAHQTRQDHGLLDLSKDLDLADVADRTTPKETDREQRAPDMLVRKTNTVPRLSPSLPLSQQLSRGSISASDFEMVLSRRRHLAAAEKEKLKQGYTACMACPENSDGRNAVSQAIDRHIRALDNAANWTGAVPGVGLEEATEACVDDGCVRSVNPPRISRTARPEPTPATVTTISPSASTVGAGHNTEPHPTRQTPRSKEQHQQQSHSNASLIPLSRGSIASARLRYFELSTSGNLPVADHGKELGSRNTGSCTAKQPPEIVDLTDD